MGDRMSNEPASKPNMTRQKRGVRKPLIIALAAVVAAALLVQATFSPLDLDRDGRSGSGSERLHGQALTPMEALSLSVPDASVDVDAAIADAQARLSVLIDEQMATANATVTGTLRSLQSLLSLYAGLPALPVGYVPGVDVEGTAYMVLSYPVPVLETTIALSGVVGPVWQSLPSQIPVQPGLVPGAPAADIDPIVQELLDVLGGIPELGELQGVIATLEGLAGGTPLGGTPLGGLPLGVGGVPDLNGVVSPHEEGARVALQHAQSLLSTADGAFGQLQGSADVVLQTQGKLVQQVSTTLRETESTVLKASQDIMAEAAARGDQTLQDLTRLQRELEAFLHAYLGALEQAVLEATLVIKTAYTDLSANIQAGIDAEVDRLMQVRKQVEGDLGTQTHAVVSEAKRLVVELEQRGASQARIDAVLDALPLVRANLTAQAEASLEDVDAAIAAVQAQGDEVLTSVMKLQAKAVRLAEDLARDATGEAYARAEYGMALLVSRAEATVEAQKELALKTVRSLTMRADAESKRLVETTRGAVERVQGGLGSGLSLVGTVQQEVFAEVNTDLEYIAKVAEDYGKAPVPERKERAEYWQSVHTTVDGTMGGVLKVGDDTSRTVQRALALTESNLAGLSALL